MDEPHAFLGCVHSFIKKCTNRKIQVISNPKVQKVNTIEVLFLRNIKLFSVYEIHSVSGICTETSVYD